MADAQTTTKYFDDKTLRELANEDSIAWGRVTGILMMIVSLGLGFGILTVLYIVTR